MNIIRKKRMELLLSQIELSEAARVPRYKIQLAEQDIGIFSGQELNRLAEILKLQRSTIEHLLEKMGYSEEGEL